MRSLLLIPARMESTRFPGKPLAPILGKPMIQWVYEAASKSKASDVFVVTDSEEIIAAVESFQGNAVRTGSAPVNGTERCREALEILDPEGEEYDIIINVQGDEPLISAKDIDALIDLFETDEIDIATLIQSIREEKEYRDPNVVKALPTLFDNGFCDISYFSRAPIPYMDTFRAGMAFKHIGVYAFTVTAFEEINNLEATETEQVERLEQLRWLQHHLVISAITTDTLLIGVDQPADIKAVENILTSLA